MATASEPEDIISRLDAIVEPAPEPENAVLTDQTRLFAGPGRVCVVLSDPAPGRSTSAQTLPARQESPHYDAAWAGFDVILLIATGRYRLPAAFSAAPATCRWRPPRRPTLLVVDAWFDVMTTPGNQRIESIVLAAIVELPLAAVCAWLTYHTQQLTERRIVLLQRRRSRSPPLMPDRAA